MGNPVDVTVLGLVGGAPGGETPRVADSSAAGAGRFFHNVPPSKQNRLGKPPRTMCDVRPFNQRPKDTQKALESYMLVLFLAAWLRRQPGLR